ncbi:TonB-dependent receptor [Dyadobacter fanqingshengii]|uniref:TonB-dependent receptor n=1 Tax=Dyadobacter fanqingshengii TaxID=2906443 RepID=A0A9X1P5R7_9BACT|nr:TonB-dependent receptor [Dyadobacter fanqingshengii]MCF0038891.1 TonB-dependent receptor [Dyadobacter fanqingshengii]USJ34285.1 TonB-dependent receptor [Dyadobacter fanqingshengii]
MKLFYYLLLLISPLAYSQNTVSGKITDKKGNALPGANVFLKGTYDGTTTDANGLFSFQTTEKDTATLAATYVGYEAFETKIGVRENATDLSVKLEELANELNTVVITAGAFEASDEKRMAMLKPLDIVTTAGAAADITGAMQFLPGAQRVGEQEGLFVRGGSGQETKVVIDGMIVQNPFFSSLPDVQSRGRFNPFMFKGTSFSTGGYSAQYGQALSSVLLLNTTDKVSNNGLGISLNLANAGLNYDYATKNQSISAVAYYGNLKPLFSLVKQNVDWLQEPEFKGSSLTYRLKPTKNGVLKVYGMYSDSQLSMNSRDPASESGKTKLDLENKNSFVTSTYNDSWKEGRWSLNSGFSYSRNNDNTTLDAFNFDRFDERTQARIVLSRLLSGNNTILFGAEAHAIRLKNGFDGQSYDLKDRYTAAFVESEIYITRELAGRIGLRTEYSSLLKDYNLAPRLSFAYKTGKYSQVSLAAGQFYQNPDYKYLYTNKNLDYERADHLILNYQICKNQRTFRFEAFYKNYAQLVREFTGQKFDADPYRFPWGETNNAGKGYARGFDFFWRDQKTIKNFDYWVTYSFVDSKRLFQQFEESTTPTFISNHNISLITKKWFEKITTNVSMTYAFTSGRPYYNPNNEHFLGDKTAPVHNVNIQASKLQNVFGNLVIFYASVDNILNTKNVFTYRYTPDGKTRYAVGPQSYRNFFVGMQIMLSKKAKVSKDDI